MQAIKEKKVTCLPQMFAETLLYLQAVKTLESHNVRHNYSKIPMLYML